MNFISNINFKNIAYLFSCAIFFIFTSCEEDLTKPKGGDEKNFPSQIIHNAKIVQREQTYCDGIANVQKNLQWIILSVQ